MCADRYLEADPKQIPIPTLAFTIAGNNRIYFAPVTIAFDYSAESWDIKDERKFSSKINNKKVPPRSVLVEFNTETGTRREIGLMETEDGKAIYGLGGAVYNPVDNSLYFAGAMEEHDPEKIAGEIDETWPYSMGLFIYPLSE
jgi:hypothetical protein